MSVHVLCGDGSERARRGGARACRGRERVSVLLSQAPTNFDARFLVRAGCSALAHNDAVVALAPTFRPGSASSRSEYASDTFNCKAREMQATKALHMTQAYADDVVKDARRKRS